MGQGLDWVCWIVGALLGALALWLLYWSLLKDRSRGRRRCPKCWYDMSGSPALGLVCSECGHEARREKNLFKTRRRWRWALFALLLVPLSMYVGRARSVGREGWLGLFPTSVLVLLVSWSDDESLSTSWGASLVNHLLIDRVDAYGQKYPPPPELWDWQWRMLIQHALSENKLVPVAAKHNASILSAAFARGIAYRLKMDAQVAARLLVVDVGTRKTWPRDVALPVEIYLDEFSRSLLAPLQLTVTPCIRTTRTPATWSQVQSPSWANRKSSWRFTEFGLLTIPDANDGEVEIDFVLEFGIQGRDRSNRSVIQPVLRTVVTKQVWIAGLLEDFIRAQHDAAMDDLVRRGFEMKFAAPATLQVHLGGRVLDIEAAGSQARLQLIRDGEVVFDQTARLSLPPARQHEPQDDRISAIFDVHDLSDAIVSEVDASKSRWKCRFSIDAAAMLYIDSGRRDSYWPGKIEEPIDWHALTQGLPIRCTNGR